MEGGSRTGSQKVLELIIRQGAIERIWPTLPCRFKVGSLAATKAELVAVLCATRVTFSHKEPARWARMWSTMLLMSYVPISSKVKSQYCYISAGIALFKVAWPSVRERPLVQPIQTSKPIAASCIGQASAVSSVLVKKSLASENMPCVMSKGPLEGKTSTLGVILNMMIS